MPCCGSLQPADHNYKCCFSCVQRTFSNSAGIRFPASGFGCLNHIAYIYIWHDSSVSLLLKATCSAQLHLLVIGLINLVLRYVIKVTRTVTDNNSNNVHLSCTHQHPEHWCWKERKRNVTLWQSQSSGHRTFQSAYPVRPLLWRLDSTPVHFIVQIVIIYNCYNSHSAIIIKLFTWGHVFFFFTFTFDGLTFVCLFMNLWCLLCVYSVSFGCLFC